MGRAPRNSYVSSGSCSQCEQLPKYPCPQSPRDCQASGKEADSGDDTWPVQVGDTRDRVTGGTASRITGAEADQETTNQ